MAQLGKQDRMTLVRGLVLANFRETREIRRKQARDYEMSSDCAPALYSQGKTAKIRRLTFC